jgi:hypothetical protein
MSGRPLLIAAQVVALSVMACGDKSTGDAGGSGGRTGSAGGRAADGGSFGAQSNAGRAGVAAAVGGSADVVGGTSAAGGTSAGGMGGSSTIAGRAGASSGAGGVGGRGGGSGAAGSGGTQAQHDDFFGASRCTAALLLCDGFEAAAIDKSVWQTKFTAPTLDSTRAARGSQSLHFSTSATGSSGIETSKIFPTAKNAYYGRMFVYFDALPTSPQWAHWTIAGAKGTSVAGEIRVGGQFDGKTNRFGVGSDGGPTGDWTNLDADPQSAGSTQVPEDRWLCVEWLHDGAADESRFFLDGVEHPSLHTNRDVKHGGNASAKYDLPDMTAVWVGFWNYDQGKTVVPNHFDVWIDEVAFDDERIGCSL